MISQVVFILILVSGIYFFTKNVRKIRRNILLGKSYNPGTQFGDRLKNMCLMALGQRKMFDRPISAFLHILVYAGFILINIEVLEIFADGILHSHRVFSGFFGNFYFLVIGFFELLALGVLVACVFFLIRRHIVRISRFNSKDLEGFPAKDATIILVTEIIMMCAVLIMNVCDVELQQKAQLPVSTLFYGFISNANESYIHIIERVAWWSHFVGIILFLNYVPFSKHFHIIMAFPNTWYANLLPKGKLENLESVAQEVKLMLDPSASIPEGYIQPSSFGVKDIYDLSIKNLMDAYTCTECGRCTSVCPANITGKKLSPRKIIMSVRDRLEETGENIDKSGKEFKDNKSLHDYISAEELWACNTCNACYEACPVQINPMEIIYKMRQYLIMEKSEAPSEINIMFSNIENNGAPWQFSAMDRNNWASEI
ncbi:MAG: 4Fe-4S dicluster domain-containing protein [Bacteroidetes bacterium]|nr:4Fe-4S dicluster domain-containing protein [Bacteroidota bacterium]